MSRMGYRARVDDNQAEIVRHLRKIGASVALDHDDILIGYRGQNFWVEIKDPAKCFKADGITFKKGAIKDSQSKLMSTWQGQYAICWNIEMILEVIGHGKN